MTSRGAGAVARGLNLVPRAGFQTLPKKKWLVSVANSLHQGVTVAMPSLYRGQVENASFSMRLAMGI